jgi:predicted anti-sigma-YlaC factor YlaD
MNMNETITATGAVSIEVFDEYGKMKEKVHVPNLVVTTGRNYISGLIKNAGTVEPQMTHMAVGSSTAAPALGDVALGSQLERVVLTDTILLNNTLTYTATYAPGVATGSISEAGIFDAASAGTMLCRTVFGVVTKDVGDTMSVTWIVTIS